MILLKSKIDYIGSKRGARGFIWPHSRQGLIHATHQNQKREPHGHTIRLKSELQKVPQGSEGHAR